MSNAAKLAIIKTIHTIIWAMFVAIIGYVVWCGATDNISLYSWLASAMVIVEGIVLVLFKGRCPLTVVARRYSNSAAHNFDIYLPEWLARYNKVVFTSIYLLGLVLMIARTVL